MSISISGNDLIWDGTVTITNATDTSTGVMTLILTPAGGVGTLPALAQGTSGLPPVFDSVNVTTLAAGASATANLTTVSTGGAGVASHYTLDLGIPQGAAGTSGTFTIATATDLEGVQTNDYMLKWVTADSKFKYVAQLCGDTYSITTFTSYSGNATQATLGSITIPAQPFNWRPRVSGLAIPTGTANTHVDLQCRLNNATTGDQVGYGYGITGAGSGSIPAYPVSLVQAFGGAITGSYGLVTAGSAATLYFIAKQTATTTDSWAATAADCYFSVKVDPVPGTN